MAELSPLLLLLPLPLLLLILPLPLLLVVRLLEVDGGEEDGAAAGDDDDADADDGADSKLLPADLIEDPRHCCCDCD